MKKALLFWAIVGISSLILISCGGSDPEPEPEKTPEEKATEALTGTGSLTWTVAGGGSVTRGGTTVTDLYQSFELTLSSTSSKTYTSSNNNDLFDNSGNWTFAGSNFDKFSLSGAQPAAGREISFTRTGDNLRLQFSIPVPGARLQGTHAVAGDYVFNLILK